jgi:hypothetical protein
MPGVDARRCGGAVGDRVVEHALQAARLDLVHRVPAKARRLHPGEVLRARPGATRNGVPCEIRTP